MAEERQVGYADEEPEFAAIAGLEINGVVETDEFHPHHQIPNPPR